ncbi:MAG: MmgE/PrpD family protein [Betaproteobacteria bacterium]|nr:MmgE/PrpD family protein [Betaproteobacteria bacterium]
MKSAVAASSVTEAVAEKAAALRPERIPAAVRRRAEDLLVDVIGLCVSARGTDYVQALTRAMDTGGPCTAIGLRGGYGAADAALLNGTAAHGEDFDDTFEGGPVHSSAVVIPAVLAACERFQRDGRAALIGTVAGVEFLCRLSMVIPKAIHKAGFHPTSVLGTLGATLAAAKAMGLDRRQTVDALGIAGSLASGIIEYLTDGAWTKRMHPGWAAQAGLSAARFGAQGFLGPRTVLEGTHGLFHGFARSVEGDYGQVTEGFGERWHMENITFKPYATGTMNQPYIECALRLRNRGVRPEDIGEIQCETAEGYVHRLWEPLASKHRPANAYGAKFSAPFNIAVAMVTGGAGLSAFTEETARDERVLVLASKVRYVVDPANPYPKAYTGHIRATLRDGRVLEERQGHIRGGAHDPLTREEIHAKFLGNCEYGGWPKERALRFLETVPGMFDGALDLKPLRG